MQKTLKRLFVLLLSAALVACIAVIAACNKNDDDAKTEKIEEGKMLVTVYYPDGSLVDGQHDGTKMDSDTLSETAVWIQFCVVGEGGACAIPVCLGADGKVLIDIQQNILLGLSGGDGYVAGTSQIAVHVLGLEGYIEGADGEYGLFTEDKFPSGGKLDIHLQRVAAE